MRLQDYCPLLSELGRKTGPVAHAIRLRTRHAITRLRGDQFGRYGPIYWGGGQITHSLSDYSSIDSRPALVKRERQKPRCIQPTICGHAECGYQGMEEESSKHRNYPGSRKKRDRLPKSRHPHLDYTGNLGAFWQSVPFLLQFLWKHLDSY